MVTDNLRDDLRSQPRRAAARGRKPAEGKSPRLGSFICPIGAYALHGLAFWQGQAIGLDAVRGHLLGLDLVNDGATILNPYAVEAFLGGRGLAIAPVAPQDDAPPDAPPDAQLWFTQERSIYSVRLSDLQARDPSRAKPPAHWLELPYDLDGVAVWKSTLYASSRRAGCIYVLNLNTAQTVTRLYAPGIGPEGLCVRNEELWVCDGLEQTVFCLERATGQVLWSAMTPFESPTALAFEDLAPADTLDELDEFQPRLYVTYAGEEPYIRDEPNDPNNPLQVSWRDRTGLHPLVWQAATGQPPAEASVGVSLAEQSPHPRRYVLSNGYRVEMFYVEELAALEGVDFSQLYDLEWRIALPSDTDRQTVVAVEPIGLPFHEEALPGGQRLARLALRTLAEGEGRLFGWKATLELRGIRYQLTPRDVENLPNRLPEGFAERYLVDNDDLSMDNPLVIAAAKEAIGTETNLLRKILAIRNYTYDRLSYRLRPRIDRPDVALARGTACCGEYVGVLLALARLNGIACRTVGRYKCPGPGDRMGIPLYPDYNHVWLEFYLPGIGWLPMESNPDDIQEGGPYPTRYFMALPWNHVEIAKGVRFQSLTRNEEPIPDISFGDLAMNHVRFRILEELP